MTLFVVRHANAGRRQDWVGDDGLRPLSARGLRQAGAIAELIAPCAPTRIVSSPTVRCVQTVEPLATALGIDVVEDVRLGQDHDVGEVGTLVDELRTVDAVVCSHGEVIPFVLEALIDGGMRPDRDLVWQKGSTWVVERVDGRWGRGRYVPPVPKRRS